MFFRTIITPQQHNNNDTSVSTHLYQDDDEADGVYRAMPVVDNSSLLSEPKEVKLNFDRDTCVLVPGLLAFDRFKITLPGGKQWVVADYWNDVKDIVEDPFISSPSSLGVSFKKFVVLV
jgi:hypothetical protein